MGRDRQQHQGIYTAPMDHSYRANMGGSNGSRGGARRGIGVLGGARTHADLVADLHELRGDGLPDHAGPEHSDPHVVQPLR